MNLTESHKSPAYRIEVNGKDITRKMEARLVSLTLVDARGFEADQLDIVLDDSDGSLAIPSKGAILSVAIGWEDSGLVDKGDFIADEIVLDGPPDTMTIRASSADLRADFLTMREYSWHGMTIGQIVAAIGERSQLLPTVSDGLRNILIDHIDQTNESDASFLTRLAGRYDAIATVKAGRLLFIHECAGVTASGLPLPTVTVIRESGDRFHFGVADRESYTHVKACWYDLNNRTKEEIIWGKEEEAAELAKAVRSPLVSTSPTVQIDGGEKKIKALRHAYQSKEAAKKAARANWAKLQRGMAEFTITLAYGNPELMPEVPCNVEGFKKEIDNTDWILKKVTHNMNDNGYTTALELEIRATEIPG